MGGEEGCLVGLGWRGLGRQHRQSLYNNGVPHFFVHISHQTVHELHKKYVLQPSIIVSQGLYPADRAAGRRHYLRDFFLVVSHDWRLCLGLFILYLINV